MADADPNGIRKGLQRVVWRRWLCDLRSEMERLLFFWFLLMQATFFGVGLIAAAMTILVLALPERRDLSRLLLLPAIWILPLALGGAFYEREVKTAGWLSNAALPMLVMYVGLSIWSVMTLPGRRAIAVACAVINAPFAAMSAIVTAIAAGGVWP